ncbi:MAG TPA: D-Ala-D-Ala carboxypeptidase family metallohydrolase [Myxococcota bacterium]|nr:D-Ala-D-Ala carboxypeptidase family metallohydrolase [Myxococcota bacterium]
MQARSLIWLSLAVALCAAAPRFAAGDAVLWEKTDARASFALAHGGVSSRLRVAFDALLPRQTLRISAHGRDGTALAISVTGAPGLSRTEPGAWAYRAPAKPGSLARLRVTSAAAADEIALTVFVLVPRARIRDGRLNGYEIGRYPPPTEVQGARVEPPPGFIEVTAANQATPVSAHFQLADFSCKEGGDFPKYLVLDPRLPAKLEALLAALHAHDIAARGLVVMSGYRTPAYNRALGNSTAYSRHLWGGAADVYVDESPRDGKMDDLNHDGVVDKRDAETLFAIADALDRAPAEDWTVGGAGAYEATDAHGPFLHVDVRGHASRW